MKTVLFLINGFGIEQKGSYSVYNKELMPNFDRLMNEYMFQTLESNINNYQEGYRNVSLEINEIYNYSIVDKSISDTTILNNQTILNLKSTLEERKSKLHLFCLVDKSPKIVDQLKSILKIINPNLEKKIYLHIVLTSNNIEDYPEIADVLSKMNVELSEYATIGMTLGLANISNDTKAVDMNFFVKTLISEVGERWQSFKQKLDVSYGMKQSPILVKPFIVNTGFSIAKDDLVTFINYDKVDPTNFINTIKNINYGEEKNNISFSSLFPITYSENIPYAFDYQLASNSLASNIKGLDFKALVMANKDQINVINYYLNGLESVSNPKINYIEFDNYLYKPQELLNIINTYDHELMILNYSIDDVKDIEELKFRLHNIDIMLENIYRNSKLNNYSIIISSLYGINKVLDNEKGEICNIIYHGKVPIIYIDNFITKKDYLIEYGNVNDLFKVCYKNINKNYPGHSIVTKKNFLYRLFFK